MDFAAACTISPQSARTEGRRRMKTREEAKQKRWGKDNDEGGTAEGEELRTEDEELKTEDAELRTKGEGMQVETSEVR